jgi:hypothetical protein
MQQCSAAAEFFSANIPSLINAFVAVQHATVDATVVVAL